MVEAICADLVHARADAEDRERVFQEMLADAARAQSVIKGLSADLARAQADSTRARADAEDKEHVIKELTSIIVEKDHRIAGPVSLACKRRGPWWRHIIPIRV